MQNRASTVLAASPTTADLVDVLLAGLAVGDPLRAGSLSLFPLAARDPLREPVTRVVTLGEAIERAWLTFRVVRDEASTRVLVQSWADAAILITAGEELPGCGGLVAVRDVLAPPGARGLAVPAKHAPGAPGFGDQRSWQRRVRALEAIAAGFPSGCEGVLIAVGDRAARLELFPSAWLLSRARAGVLRAAAFEALADPGRSPAELRGGRAVPPRARGPAVDAARTGGARARSGRIGSRGHGRVPCSSGARSYTSRRCAMGTGSCSRRPSRPLLDAGAGSWEDPARP